MIAVSTSKITVTDSSWLKGLAITAVVLLHILAYPKGIYFASSTQWLFVLLDQAARFCVPLFLLVSGYGLAMKYSRTTFTWREYLSARFTALVPAYLLWSVVSILLVKMVPAWSFGNQPTNLVVQMLLGQADYQLYFLPVIFQMYFVFPLLWKGRRWLSVWLVLALVLQLVWYLWLGEKLALLPPAAAFRTDRFEYLLGISWIGYFVAGIWLARTKVSSLVLKVMPVVAVTAIVGVVYFTIQAINTGTDPLLALKFTRWPVLVYALAASLSLVWVLPKIRAMVSPRLMQMVEWLGKHSFLIFLSHTLALRLIYSIMVVPIDLKLWVVVAAAWAMTVIVTKRWILR